MTPSLARVIATVGGVGHLRPGPGTWGSAFATLVAFPIAELGSRWALGAFFVVAAVIGTWACHQYAAETKTDDPSEAVIDEVAGVWLTLALVPSGLVAWALGFVFFRLFDIWKPWPISWANNHVPGGVGIMLDDLLAGLAAAFVTTLVVTQVGP